MKTIYNIIVLCGFIFSILGLVTVGFKWIWLITLILTSIYMIKLMANKEQTPMDKTVEGEDIKLVNVKDLYANTEDTLIDTIIEKHNSEYLLICFYDDLFGYKSINGGRFAVKNGDGILQSEAVINTIMKIGNTYELYVYGLNEPLYILYTDDNGKIIEVK